MGKHWTLSKEIRQSRSDARIQSTSDSDIKLVGNYAQIKVDKNNIVLVDIVDLSQVKVRKWWYDHGYARTKIDGKSVYLHRLIMDFPKGNIDHINGNKLDNRRSNLRTCNQSQNMANVGLSKANKTGYKGVFWRKEKKKFTAYITVNKKRTYLGYFTDAIEASKAYDKAAKKAWGEFAVLNNVTG